MSFKIISGPSREEIVAGTHEESSTCADYTFRLMIGGDEVDVQANIQLAGLKNAYGDYILQIQVYLEESSSLNIYYGEKPLLVEYNADTGMGRVLEGTVPVPFFYGCG